MENYSIWFKKWEVHHFLSLFAFFDSNAKRCKIYNYYFVSSSFKLSIQMGRLSYAKRNKANDLMCVRRRMWSEVKCLSSRERQNSKIIIFQQQYVQCTKEHFNLTAFSMIIGDTQHHSFEFLYLLRYFRRRPFSLFFHFWSCVLFSFSHSIQFHFVCNSNDIFCDGTRITKTNQCHFYGIQRKVCVCIAVRILFMLIAILANLMWSQSRNYPVKWLYSHCNTTKGSSFIILNYRQTPAQSHSNSKSIYKVDSNQVLRNNSNWSRHIWGRCWEMRKKERHREWALINGLRVPKPKPKLL